MVIIFAVIDRTYTEGLCPKSFGKDWDVELVMAHQDCDKFYKCFNGKPLEVLCPRGLYFNIKHWRCDWIRNVNCNGRNAPEQTDAMDGDDITNNGDSESESEDVDNDENIDDESDQESVEANLELLQNGCPINTSIEWRLPHEVDCNQFYACVRTMKFERRCPPYLHFNKKLQVFSKCLKCKILFIYL